MVKVGNNGSRKEESTIVEALKRPRNTNEGDDSVNITMAALTRKRPLASIWCHLAPFRHPIISRKIIRLRLADTGIWKQHILKSLRLTLQHRQCWLDFCQSRTSWSKIKWYHVIFSDKSRFSLRAHNHCTRVWRQPSQRSDPYFVVEWHTAIIQGVTVWKAIF